MNTLGFINFSVLARVLWKSADHFLPMQTFYLGAIQEIYLSVHEPGIINGCEVTPGGALTLDIAEGLVLFANDELVTVTAQSVTLSSADPVNPRLDRLEYIHSIENNLQVTDIDAVIKQFDKVQTGTAGALTGTPAANPSPNAKTAGAVSIAVISVADTQTVTLAADIDQRETSRDIARKKSNVIFEADINNNVSGSALPLAVADKAKYRQYWFDYIVQRKTDIGASGVTQSGTLSARLNTETGDWDFTDSAEGDAGVDFSVDPVTGRVEYDSTDIAGANYVGKVEYITRVLPV